MNRDKLARWIATIAAVLAALGVTISIVDTDGDGSPDRADITFKVNQQPDDGARSIEVTVPAPLAEQAARSTEGDLRDERPPEAVEAVPEQLRSAEQKQDEIRREQEPLPTAGATASIDGCVTRFVRNQSSRNGVRPQHQTLHYTVSTNRPGWDDVWAIVNYFNGPSGASSNFVIDAEGHCAYIVPIESKPWTQAAANPFAISYEIIAYGNEQVYLEEAGYEKLRHVMQQVSARTGIPMRRGATSGCTPTKTGIVQHYDYGICGGGHHDIRPFSVDQVIQIVASGGASSLLSRLTEPEQKIVRRRCAHWYKHQRARGTARRTQLRYSRHWRARAAAQKRTLDARHRRGRSWKRLDSGIRRKSMARAERMKKADRKALC